MTIVPTLTLTDRRTSVLLCRLQNPGNPGKLYRFGNSKPAEIDDFPRQRLPKYYQTAPLFRPYPQRRSLAEAQGRNAVTRLSIVIPCLAGAEQAEETLVSVLQNRPDDCEIIVPHALPYDDPYHLDGEVCFLHVAAHPSLVDLVNAALDQAEGDVIHTLACGIAVEEGWTNQALVHFADPKVGAVAPLVVQRDQPTRIETLGAGYTRGGLRYRVGHNQPLPRRHKLADQIVGPTLAAGFYAHELLDALGGFADAVGDELADIDLALSLSELGFRAAFAPECKLHASGDIEQGKRTGALSRGRRLERLFLRHAAARGGIWALLAHPLAIGADTWRELPSLATAFKLLGRFIASWEFGTIQAYKQRMAEAADYLAHEPTLEEARRLLEAETPPALLPQVQPVSRKAA